MKPYTPAMKRFYVFAPALAVLLFALGTSAHARLEFAEPVKELTFPVGETSTALAYTFVNNGTRPVTIEAVNTSCGCTSSKPTKTVYAPGEAGTIDVVYTPGSRKGNQRTSINVRTDDPTQRDYRLTLLVDIPEPIILSERVLIWKIGEAPEPKELTVQIHEDLDIHIEDIDYADDVFDVRIEEIEHGSLYKLKAWPLDTSTTARTTLRLQTDFGEGRTLYVYLRVQ